MHQAVAEFTWAEAEYIKVSRSYGIARAFLLCMLFGAAVFVGMGILLAVVGRGAGVFLCILGLLYVLYGLWFSFAVPRRSWRKTPRVRGHQHFVFTDETISVTSGLSEKSEGWGPYKYVSEKADWYLLSSTRRFATVFIPKRAFSSPRDEAVFRALARSHSRSSLVANVELDGLVMLPPPGPPD